MTKLYMIYYGDTPAHKVVYMCKRKDYLYEKTAVNKMERVKEILTKYPQYNVDPEKLHVVTFVPEGG